MTIPDPVDQQKEAKQPESIDLVLNVNPTKLPSQSSPPILALKGKGILNEDQKLQFPSLMRMDVRFWVDFQADLAPRCLSRPPDQVEVDLVARHNLWKINSLIDIS